MYNGEGIMYNGMNGERERIAGFPCRSIKPRKYETKMKTFYKLAVATAAFGLPLAFAASASAATLSLSPSAQTVNVGDTFTVQVLLDTQGQAVDGVDVSALNYNPYFLQVQGVQVQPGSLMADT